MDAAHAYQMDEAEAQRQLRAIPSGQKRHCVRYPGWDQLSWNQRLFVARNPGVPHTSWATYFGPPTSLAEMKARMQAEKDEAARVQAEAEAARLAAEQEAAKLAAEEEAQRVAAAAEEARAAAARLAAEQEAARLAEIEKQERE